MKFGDYLRKCRDNKSWTQPEAAAQIEIEQSYLSKLETGKSFPSEDIFNKLVEVYQIDTDKLYEEISSEELAKLKDLKQVRTAIMQRHEAKVTTTRGWLVTGLILLIMGGSFLGFAIIPTHTGMEYVYRSEGILLEDESLDQFEIVQRRLGDHIHDQKLVEKQKSLLARLDQMDEITTQNRGGGFVKSTLKGRRYFKKIAENEVEINAGFRWFFAPAFMLIFGAVGCFYISRRWN